jgi:hypothetical protein
MKLERPKSAKAADEAVLNAAFAVLRNLGVGDGMLGVYFREPVNSYVLQFEAENSSYFEWVRVDLSSLDNLPEAVLLEAATRLAVRIGITYKRFLQSKLN